MQRIIASALGVACAAQFASSASGDVFQIALNYNFNGIVHAGEDAMPDNPDGYRSISDRGLNFSGGMPSDAMVDRYNLVDTAGVLDIVHLGNRNNAAGGAFAFDAAPDGDDVGVEPTWLGGNPDQSATQTTVLGTPIVLDGTSSAGFLFQISDGGGNFDVRFGFDSGADVVATIGGGDWFGGAYAGTDRVDFGNLFGAQLHIMEGTVDLSGEAGRTLTSIGFENRSNTRAGYAILAGNVSGIPAPGTAVVAIAGLAACRRRRA